MARDIPQPQRQVHSPRSQQVAFVPAQKTSASGTTREQDFGRVLNGLNNLSGQYAQEKVRQQRAIDTADKHNFMANKSRYVPEIMKAIEENNLQGAPAEEVYEFAKGTEAYQQLYAGFQDEDNLKLYQENNDAALVGEFTNWQTKYEEQQRQDRFTGALTTELAEASPEERLRVVKEYRDEAQAPDGAYKMRPEEVNAQFVSLAQAYNQAGQYDMAQSLLEDTEFDDGSAPLANLQLKTAQAGIEKQRMEALTKEFENRYYEAHNDPEITEAKARGIVNEAYEKGLLQKGRDREAVYDFIMSGGPNATQNQMALLLSDQGLRQMKTVEGMDNYLERLKAKHGISDKNGDMAREYLVGERFAAAYEPYQEALQAYQEDPDDPQLEADFEQARGQYQEALRFAPAHIQSQLVDFHNLTTDADGYPPEAAKALGALFEEVEQAFSGNTAEALKTYFPEDKEVRRRLSQLQMLKESNGGSWEMAFKKSFELHNGGPAHYTWNDKDDVAEYEAKFVDKYGAGSALREYRSEMATLKAGKLSNAHERVMQTREQDQSHIRERRPLLADSYQFKGKNGKAFAQNFTKAVAHAFKDEPDFDENQPFEVLESYIEDELVAYQLASGLPVQKVDPEDAFTKDHAVIVEAHPTDPTAITLKMATGYLLAPRVSIEEILEKDRIRKERKSKQTKTRVRQGYENFKRLQQ